MNIRPLAAILLLLTTPVSANAIAADREDLTVGSPDGSLCVAVQLADGVPVYSVTRGGKPLILPSKLGFLLEGDTDLSRNFAVANTARRSVSDSWQQPWGEQREVPCRFNELRIDLKQRDAAARRMTLVFRVFDDGVGFRYEWPEQAALDSLVIDDELTEFALAEDGTAWWIPAYEDNRYEYLYHNTPVSELKKVHTPVTVQMPGGTCLSIHEAALIDFASMTLARASGTTLKADLVPWSDGVKVRASLPHHSPWRTIVVADDPGGLVDSRMILNLNEPARIADTGWIRIGKYTGVWWEMHLDVATWGSGERHGATTEYVKRRIDFASKYGLGGVLVEGWNEGWDGNWYENGNRFSFTKPYPDFDLKQITDYARQKGVYLIGHHETAGAIENYERQMEDAYSLYNEVGVPVVKSGYVNQGQNIVRHDAQGNECREWHHGQYMVRHYLHALQEAARHHISLVVHEPIKQTGLRRTYPNLLACEGARGQEYNAWSPDGGNPPDHTTIIPFTRLLGGPMDFTPGIFDLLFEKARPNNRVNTTLTKQLALYVVLYSPVQMLPDLQENYEARPDAFQFILDVPTDWEESHTLNGEIGDYITIVRKQRGGDDWYLGSITDQEGRTLDVPLSFLDAGRTYTAEIYRDAPDADWETAPYAYVIEKRDVTADQTLTLRLAPGGGQAIRFHPADSVE